jgi:hypothetical protein
MADLCNSQKEPTITKDTTSGPFLLQVNILSRPRGGMTIVCFSIRYKLNNTLPAESF